MVWKTDWFSTRKWIYQITGLANKTLNRVSPPTRDQKPNDDGGSKSSDENTLSQDLQLSKISTGEFEALSSKRKSRSKESVSFCPTKKAKEVQFVEEQAADIQERYTFFEGRRMIVERIARFEKKDKDGIQKFIDNGNLRSSVTNLGKFIPESDMGVLCSVTTKTIPWSFS